MTEPTAPSGVIPYVDHHTGPKRLLTVSLEANTGLLGGVSKVGIKPNLFVDGRQYIVYWGPVTVEIPADRSVHIGVGMQDGLRGASVLLPSSRDDLHLRYVVGATGEPSFGPAAPPGPPAR